MNILCDGIEHFQTTGVIFLKVNLGIGVTFVSGMAYPTDRLLFIYWHSFSVGIHPS